MTLTRLLGMGATFSLLALCASGDEYLDFATKNRKEWEQKGQAIVEKMKERRLPPGYRAHIHIIVLHKLFM